MAQPDERIADNDGGPLADETAITPQLRRDAIELAERDTDHAYDQTIHSGKLALGLLTALGLASTTGAGFFTFSFFSFRAPHLCGWILIAAFVALFAATFVNCVLTIRSSMPPRHKVTVEHAGWLATQAVPPDQLVQYYLNLARQRLAATAAEAQRLGSVAHDKHRRNFLTGSLLIGTVLTGITTIIALRFGW